MADPTEVLKRLNEIQPEVTASDVLNRLDGQQGQIVYVAPNGGLVRRGPQGLSYADESASTSDPAIIESIMSGEEPSRAFMSSQDRLTLSQAPLAARATKFVEGVPFIGSHFDNWFERAGMPEVAQGMRASSGAMGRERPKESFGLNLAGAVTGSVPMAMAAPEVMTATGLAGKPRLVQALAGLFGGGIAGAGEATVYEMGREDPNLSLAAGVGGATGAAAGLVAPYAGAMLRPLTQWAKGSDVATIATGLGVSKDAATVIRNAFRSGDLNAARDALNMAGESGMLADAGQAARELLDAAAASGGQAGTIARDAVEGRATAARGEIETALDSAFGKPLARTTAVDAIREPGKATRSALYDDAYASAIDYSGELGQYIESVLPRVPASAVKNANELMRVQGATSKQIMAEIADDGSVAFRVMPDVQQIHYILQGLDDTIEAAKGPLGKGTTKSTAYGTLRRQLANALKKEVPAFKAAQDAYADMARQEAAFGVGADAFRTKTRWDELRASMKGMSKAEVEAVRRGARSYIEETLANVSRTVTDPNVDAREAIKLVKDLSSRASKAKIVEIIGRDGAESLFKALDKETVALELRAAIAANSKTAIRQSIQQGVKDQTAPGMVSELAQGKPVDATRRLVQAISGVTPEAQTLRQMGLFEEIAAVLTNTKGKGAEKALKLVQGAIAGQPLNQAQVDTISRVTVAAAALTAHRQAQRYQQN